MVVVQSRVQWVRRAPERSSAQGAGAHNRRRHGAVTPEEFGESDPDGDELELVHDQLALCDDPDICLPDIQ